MTAFGIVINMFGGQLGAAVGRKSDNSKVLAFSCVHSLLGMWQQFSRPACIGGHGTLPYEQNTQQSPGLGLSKTSQLVHW